MTILRIDWLSYQNRFVLPVLRRAEQILRAEGKQDCYTLADLERAIEAAKRELVN